jgi:hypothetical protein
MVFLTLFILAFYKGFVAITERLFATTVAKKKREINTYLTDDNVKVDTSQVKSKQAVAQIPFAGSKTFFDKTKPRSRRCQNSP